MSEVWNVYVLTCIETGKQYVGITRKPVAVRWASHVVAAYGKPSPKFHSQRTIIASAIRESGADNWKCEHVLCCCSRADAEHCEAVMVRALGCQHPGGFNATPSGNSRGYVASLETSAKISTTKRAQWAELSDDERVALGKQMGKRVRDWWAQLSTAQRQDKIDKLRTWARSPENRARIGVIGKTRVTKDRAFEANRRAGIRAATRAGRMGSKAHCTIRDRRQETML